MGLVLFENGIVAHHHELVDQQERGRVIARRSSLVTIGSLCIGPAHLQEHHRTTQFPGNMIEIHDETVDLGELGVWQVGSDFEVLEETLLCVCVAAWFKKRARGEYGWEAHPRYRSRAERTQTNMTMRRF